MLRDSNDVNYERMNISILEGGGLYDLEEIITELKKYHANFDSHSMNENSLYLQGQEDMLTKIINYLENCL